MALWGKYRLVLRAVVDGKDYPDVVAFSATFALNEIPNGSLLLAIGRNIETLQAATIHNTVQSLKIKLPAQVYMRAIPEGAAPGVQEPLTGKEFMIFDGYAVGSGWKRSRGEAQFVLHLLHWLDDLNASSTLSATSHPSNPADFSFGAVFPALGINAAGGGNPNLSEPVWAATCDATKAIGEAQLETDLWKEVLFPWLQTIASQDRLDFNPPGGGGISRGLNDRAKRALARMDPATIKDCAVTPLAMDLAGANGGAVANGVRAYIERDTFATWVHTTFWGKLIGEWGPQFMFSVVPRVTDAFPIPFTGPLRATFKTITPNDYEFANILSPMSQVLQGVGMTHAAQHHTGANMSPAEFQIGFSRLCGWYAPGDQPEGLLLFKEPPGWITELLADDSRESTGADGKAIATAADPTAGAPPAGDTPAVAIGGVVQTSLMNRFAQHWYALETIKGRQGELSGKLRFDIAPGSSVQIIPAREKFIGTDDLSLPHFATITRVSISVNAEAQQAGTAFGLAHVRVATENERDQTSVARPPLYQAGWTGCQLVGPT